MAKTAMVQGRVDADRKKRVALILKRLGLNHSTAIDMFYSMIDEYNGIPFELKLPNDESIKAMNQVEAHEEWIKSGRKGKPPLKEYDSLEEMTQDAETG